MSFQTVHSIEESVSQAGEPQQQFSVAVPAYTATQMHAGDTFNALSSPFDVFAYLSMGGVLQRRYDAASSPLSAATPSLVANSDSSPGSASGVLPLPDPYYPETSACYGGSFSGYGAANSDGLFGEPALVADKGPVLTFTLIDDAADAYLSDFHSGSRSSGFTEDAEIFGYDDQVPPLAPLDAVAAALGGSDAPLECSPDEDEKEYEEEYEEEETEIEEENKFLEDPQEEIGPGDRQEKENMARQYSDDGEKMVFEDSHDEEDMVCEDPQEEEQKEQEEEEEQEDQMTPFDDDASYTSCLQSYQAATATRPAVPATPSLSRRTRSKSIAPASSVSIFKSKKRKVKKRLQVVTKRFPCLACGSAQFDTKFNLRRHWDTCDDAIARGWVPKYSWMCADQDCEIVVSRKENCKEHMRVVHEITKPVPIRVAWKKKGQAG